MARRNPGISKRPKRDIHLYYRYKITMDGYNALLQSQNGRCAICGDLPSVKGLVVDHDHITGRVRGLLCDPCNVGIGRLKDSAAIAEAAAAYLRGERKAVAASS
jgi:hypothetical protein